MGKSIAVKKEAAETPRAARPGFSAAGPGGLAQAKKMAKATFEENKKLFKKVPPGWPKDAVPDKARWCSWLPEDWTLCLKLTENGLLLQCYVGPAPEHKRYFHKVDVEKNIGRSLDEKREMPKEMLDAKVTKSLAKSLAESDYDSNNFLKYTGSGTGLQYMIDRCWKAHGKTIREVLSGLTQKADGGNERGYTLADLRYDLKAGRLEAVKTKAEVGKAPSKATSSSSTSSSSASATTKKRKQEEDSAATTKKCKQEGKLTGKQKVKEEPRAAASSSSSAISASLPKDLPVAADASFWQMFTKSRSQKASAGDICALVCIGRSLGVEALVLDVLPAVLAQEPKERSKYGELALKALETAMKAKKLHKIG
jgi:hypothetical protein